MFTTTKISVMTITFLMIPVIAAGFEIKGTNGTKVEAEVVATFNEPWAMTFLPDGSILVTDKKGTLQHLSVNGNKSEVNGFWTSHMGAKAALVMWFCILISQITPGFICPLP